MIGTIISHYKILEKLGGGGMGVVYKAHDLKLDRTVALKFLPPELTLDTQAKERFIHEAKAASSLDHNNICTVYDIDESADGRIFIAMACYEGETLKERIAKGKLKIEVATGIAVQIGQGLVKAHEGGIVHRDLKPANIMITKDGVAKIVDFGLAKLSNVTKLTKTGSTLGTVAYMAPEQLQGSDVDARADIFSLGVVLYEMLTGKTPFRGDHEAALMYSILNEEPKPLQTYIPDVTSELIHVVSRALEKDPVSRYKTMDDLLIDLKRVRKETSRVSMPGLGRKRSNLFTSRPFVLALCGVVLAGIAITVFLLNRPRKLPRLNPAGKAAQLQLPVKSAGYPTLSRDGKWIAFGGFDQNGKADIYHMNSSGGAAKRITNDSTVDAWAGDFSPDGGWILYTRVRPPGELVAVPTLGGPVRRIARGVGGRFLPNSDRVLYYRGGWTGIKSESGKFEVCSVKMDGSDNRVVFVDPGCASEAGTISVSFAVSPDGKSIAWIKAFRDFSQDIITHNLQTGAESQVTFTRTFKNEVAWTHDNYLIYTSYANGNYDLWMCPAEGGEQLQLTRSRTDEIAGELCDDGSRLLYYEENKNANIKTMDLETGKITSVTSDDQNRMWLCISPDNRYAAFSMSDGYNSYFSWWGIQIVEIKGGTSVGTVAGNEMTGLSRAWSPNGAWIAYSRNPDSVGGKLKICIVSPFAGTPSRTIAEVKGNPGYEQLWLQWHGTDTLRWFSRLDRKTWICSIENPSPRQFYQDSTNAYLIQDRKYILFQDLRAGRQGWWIDTSPSVRKGKSGTIKMVAPIYAMMAPDAQFLLYPQRGEIHKVSLPVGKDQLMPHKIPTPSRDVSISTDGKSLYYLEQVSNSKLMLWENPFIKE